MDVWLSAIVILLLPRQVSTRRRFRKTILSSNWEIMSMMVIAVAADSLLMLSRRKTPRCAHEPNPFSTRVPVTEAKTKRFRMTHRRDSIWSLSLSSHFLAPIQGLGVGPSDPDFLQPPPRCPIPGRTSPFPTTSVSMVILSLSSVSHYPILLLAMNNSPQMREGIINPSEWYFRGIKPMSRVWA
ncbi:hypothetical protein EV421DRAFT_1741311 [Armillaria borealis]|uniref:Uncharacterized protein n=1 Tax=Armillaria borealis TaxID=47425 RepID=A0AA39MGA0_9AGAR|nr:hypothetical protein EV421DRAFT_1741311 [Armillaria borealis]